MGENANATYTTPLPELYDLSISFRFTDEKNHSQGPLARLGWASGLAPIDYSIFPEADGYLFFLELYNDGFRIGGWNKSTSDSDVRFELGAVTKIPEAGHWLKFDLSTTPTTLHTYSVKTKLWDLGLDGNMTPELLDERSDEIINRRIAGDTSLYAGFFGYYATDRYDNFQITPIPEPRSTVLLGMGIIALLRYPRLFTRRN